MQLTELKEKFTEIYGADGEPNIYRAPGRVNLIGEHTDYNDGLVLPIAIDLTTRALVRRNPKETIRLYSIDLEEGGRIPLGGGISSKKSGCWTDYIGGIIFSLDKEKRNALSGLDILLHSEVPIGSGLSSSAALEMAVASALNTEFELGLEPLELIRLCQNAENEFVGANTGIMDQYVSYFGRENTALLIDTARTSHRYVNLDLASHELLVIDTTVSHTHEGNKYNQRREECEDALNLLKKTDKLVHLSSLSDLSPEDLGYVNSTLPEILANRTRHVVEENQRVKRAAALLAEGKIGKAGELFFASHRSLRDLYEVSCPELDFLVNFARKQGIPGARMTGGGFGGSTIHIVPEGDSDTYLKEAGEAYLAEFGIEAEGFFVSPSNGLKEFTS
ncbi:MAG: galactokinase [Candidatus Bipolaricaulota bacterium]|nr:galactokinase [Candidatus Bipolaricaulota bacterium]